jgi:TolB protein
MGLRNRITAEKQMTAMSKWLSPALIVMIGLVLMKPVALAQAPSESEVPSGSGPIKMEISGNGGQLYPIAVSALKNLGGDDGDQISNGFDMVLMRDLKLSSFFHLIDPKSYIEDAQSSGYDVGQFNFADWKSIGADFLVKGAVTRNGDSIQLEALLFDVANQRRLMGKKFNGSPHDVGEMARRFADAVMESVTGTRGPFDSKIAFVSTGGGRFKEVYAMTPELYLVDLGQQTETRINPGLGQAVGGTLTPGGNIVAAYQRNGNTNLYLIDSSGGELNAITNNQAINVSPSVCADGARLAFTSDRSGTPQIYVGSVNGGSAQRITYKGSYNTAPAFSPDCKKIAYESREGGIFQIYVIDAGGGDPGELTQSGSNESPAWSPDGRYIIFAAKGGGSSQIRLMRAEDGNVIGPLMEGEGNDSDPSWSGWLGE